MVSLYQGHNNDLGLLTNNSCLQFSLNAEVKHWPFGKLFCCHPSARGQQWQSHPSAIHKSISETFFQLFSTILNWKLCRWLRHLSRPISNKKSDVLVLVPAQTTCESLDIEATEYRSKDFGDNLVKKNPIAYVAGYLLNRCFKKHTCSNCKDALVTENLDDNRNLLNFFKAYESAKNFGGLLIPSSPFLQYVEQLEDTFITSFSIYTKCDGVGKNILVKLQQIAIPFCCCDDFPKEFLQKLFLRLRIYYSLKFANRKFSSAKKKDRKYIKVTHL